MDHCDRQEVSRYHGFRYSGFIHAFRVIVHASGHANIGGPRSCLK